MWYIIKPILVTTLWIIMESLYLIMATLICTMAFLFILRPYILPYRDMFEECDPTKTPRDRDHDNNAIDTFKRYWNGDFW